MRHHAQTGVEAQPLADVVELSDIETIKEAVLRVALKRAGPGVVLLSSKGRALEWLFDLRPLFLDRGLLARIADRFWTLYSNKEPFQIGAIETAAIPLLTAVLMRAPAERGRVSGFIVRKERKTSGLGNIIEGSVTHEPIVLLDDLVNSGSSLEKARVALKLHGGVLNRVFTVVDFRSNRGLAWRREQGVAVDSLFTLEELGLQLKTDEKRPPQQYRHIWTAEIKGGNPYHVVPKSAPLLMGERLYRGCDAGKLHAFDSNTGRIVWEHSVTGAAPQKGIWSSPAIHDGRLYFGAYNGNAYCLAAEDGREIWVRSYGEWIGASPLVVAKHRLVYFGIEYARPWAQGSIAALDCDTGEKIWEYPTKKLQHGSPAYWEGGDLIAWGTADHEMVGLDAKTGAIKWTFATERSVKYAPAVHEARRLIAFASFDKCIYVLDAATGHCRGKWQTGDICYTTPLFVGSKLFCGSGDRHFYVIDLDRMDVIKKIDLKSRVYASPRLVGNRVVVGTAGGRVVEIDTESLDIVGTLQLPDAITNAIAVSPNGSHIFVSTYMNHLYAFERLGNTSAEGDRTEASPGMRPEREQNDTGAEDGSQKFQLIASGIDIGVIQQEIEALGQLWSMDTSRQRMIKVQRDTETVFLRRAARQSGSLAPTEDLHESEAAPSAKYFPETMRFIESFAQENRRSMGRAMLVKLKPKGRVYRHRDHGEYYKVRDRFHLVIASKEGSEMICGDESVTMRAGELWWFDNKLEHESHNPSDDDRIHLIFDLSADPMTG